MDSVEHEAAAEREQRPESNRGPPAALAIDAGILAHLGPIFLRSTSSRPEPWLPEPDSQTRHEQQSMLISQPSGLNPGGLY